MTHILDQLKELTIFADKVDKLYGRTDTLHLLDYVNELSAHKQELLTLIHEHIKRLEFCEYKYRGMEGSDYSQRKREFQYISDILVKLLDNE